MDRGESVPGGINVDCNTGISCLQFTKNLVCFMPCYTMLDTNKQKAAVVQSINPCNSCDLWPNRIVWLVVKPLGLFQSYRAFSPNGASGDGGRATINNADCVWETKLYMCMCVGAGPEQDYITRMYSAAQFGEGRCGSGGQGTGLCIHETREVNRYVSVRSRHTHTCICKLLQNQKLK